MLFIQIIYINVLYVGYVEYNKHHHTIYEWDCMQESHQNDLVQNYLSHSACTWAEFANLFVCICQHVVCIDGLGLCVITDVVCSHIWCIVFIVNCNVIVDINVNQNIQTYFESINLVNKIKLNNSLLVWPKCTICIWSLIYHCLAVTNVWLMIIVHQMTYLYSALQH